MRYAPRLQTWITPDERFMLGLRSRIDRMADEALAEIRDMAAKARAKYAEPDAVETIAALLRLCAGQPSQLYGRAMAQQAGLMRNVYPLGAYRSGSPLADAGIGAALGLYPPGWLNRI
jgi:hypothetical protein